jgi:CheY-like chemotaxis protein
VKLRSPPPSSRRECRVLIIDDDELARQMMTDLLTAAGHVVTRLASPIGASREVMAMGAHVVVVDVMMPSIRGDKLAQLLRKNPRLSQLGIVLVTSLERSQLEQLTPSEPGTGVVSKSDLETSLVSAVLAACRSGCK